MGWIVAPEEIYDDLWRRHEYATIAAGMLDMHLATAVLDPAVRPAVTARARSLIRRGFETLADTLAQRPDLFSVVPPEASAMSFVRYDLPVASVDLADRLLREEGVLVIPGSAFGMEHHLRVSSALPQDHLEAGLAGLLRVVAS